MKLRQILEEILIENKEYSILINPTKQEVIKYAYKYAKPAQEMAGLTDDFIRLKYVISEDDDLYIGSAFQKTHAAIKKKAGIKKDKFKGIIVISKGNLRISRPAQGLENKKLNSLEK